MANIVLKNVFKKFDNDYAVKDMNLLIKDGSFTVLLGPSGCGKSTTLRMIAGLEKQTSGNIYIGDRLVNDVEPGKRGVAMVFQNYALYPTMTVRENIEFGLENNKIPKEERNLLIEDITKTVSLNEYLDRKPSQLSGGQRQRVALARAMVKKPDVFILDEPLSNLDAKLRVQMRVELKKLHEELKTTFIYVTHDQVEAMSMGTEIVILNKGEIMQVDNPREVYNNPKNLFTAQFIGSPPMNIQNIENIKSHFKSLDPKVHYVGFRPEDGQLRLVKPQDSKNIILKSHIQTVEVLGSETVYTVSNEFGNVQIKSFEKNTIGGKDAYLEIPRRSLKYFDENGDLIIPINTPLELFGNDEEYLNDEVING